jgi:hypothetical protein
VEGPARRNKSTNFDKHHGTDIEAIPRFQQKQLMWRQFKTGVANNEVDITDNELKKWRNDKSKSDDGKQYKTDRKTK